MSPDFARRAAAVVGGALLLTTAACVTTSGGSTGASLAPGGGGNDSTASRPSAAEEHRSAVATGQNNRATIGGKKEVALATFEGDLNCTQLVAPYTLQDNTNDLLDLATTGGTRAIWTWFDEWLNGAKGKAAADASLAEAKHKIPMEVRTAALRMNWLPMQAEVLYGQMALEKFDASTLISRDERQGKALYPAADALLADLLAGIAEPHEYKFVMYLRKTPGRNALALPGGLIVVDAELIKDPGLNNKARFAVAHEIAHVLQRHETRAVQARIIDTISLRSGVTDLVRSIRLLTSNPRPLIQLVLAGKQQFERHSEVQELHSDSCATQVLERTTKSIPKVVAVVQAYVNDMPPPPAAPASAAGARGQGQDARANVENLIELVSRPIDRHPSSKERIANLNRVLASLKTRTKEPAAPRTQSNAAKSEPSRVSAPKPGKAASTS